MNGGDAARGDAGGGGGSSSASSIALAAAAPSSKAVVAGGDGGRDWDREVYVAAKVFSMLNMDIIQQTFAIEFRLVFEWHEPKLATDEPTAAVPKKVAVSEWDPKLFSPMPLIQNGTRDLDGKPGRFDVFGGPEGRVSQSWDFRGTLLHEYALRKFPFDDQQLSIVVRLKQWHGLYVEPRPHPARPSMIDRVVLPEWEVSDVVKFFNVASDPKKSTQGLVYNELVVTMHCSRVAESYLWNFGFLIFLLQSLSFASFAVDPREVADRVSIGLTLVLSAVALRFIVAEQLPRSAHLTALERYMNLAFAFVYAVAVEAFALPWYFDGEDEDDTLNDWDSHLAKGAGAFFLLQHIAAALLIWQQKRRLRRRFDRGAKVRESWRAGTGPAA